MELTTIITDGSWNDFHIDLTAQQQLLAFIPPVMQKARWFGGKGWTLRSVHCDHCLKLEHNGQTFFFFIMEVNYEGGEPEYYLLPLAKTDLADASGILCHWKGHQEEAYIMDATCNRDFHQALFQYIHDGTKIDSNIGTFRFDHGCGLPTSETYQSSANPAVEQSNSSIFYNDKYFLKIYRKLFRETNPEVEMLKFLTEKGHFNHVPAYAGSLVWERKKIPPVTLALMMQKVDARKDNWVSTGDELNDFLHSFVKGSFSIHEFVFENVELLAKRTAEMHLALNTNDQAKEFAPELYNPKYRKWLLAHLHHLLEGRLAMVANNHNRLDEDDLKLVETLQAKKQLILKFFDQVRTRPLKSLRTRIHGDYHLGQVLYTGNDFTIIDFEGEPESSIPDRKIKHSPMKDVAGMIRSFHYAVSSKLYYSTETRSMNRQRLQRASDRWFYLIRDTFLETYLAAIGKDNPLYYNKSEINFLLLLHLMEKAIYELGYELNGRPDWVKIPLKGIEQVINELEKYLE